MYSVFLVLKMLFFGVFCAPKVVQNVAKLVQKYAKVVQYDAKVVPNCAIFCLFLPRFELSMDE